MRNKRWVILLFLLFSFGLNAQKYQLSKPLIDIRGDALFEKKATIFLDFRLESAEIRFTLDGSEPSASSMLYKRPIKIKKTSQLKVKAFKPGFLASETVHTDLIKLGHKIESLEITPDPSKSYPGNGGATLIDRASGSLNFRDGNWLGYNSGPITVTIDLGKSITVGEVTLSTLTSSGSWIMPPSKIESFYSQDGKNFEAGQHQTITPLDQHISAGKAYYSLKTKRDKVRFVKLVIHPLTELPDWHPGRGNAAWVFLDEVIIN